jgi:hypothetical protein
VPPPAGSVTSVLVPPAPSVSGIVVAVVEMPPGVRCSVVSTGIQVPPARTRTGNALSSSRKVPSGSATVCDVAVVIDATTAALRVVAAVRDAAFSAGQVPAAAFGAAGRLTVLAEAVPVGASATVAAASATTTARTAARRMSCTDMAALHTGHDEVPACLVPAVAVTMAVASVRAMPKSCHGLVGAGRSVQCA